MACISCNFLDNSKASLNQSIKIDQAMNQETSELIWQNESGLVTIFRALLFSIIMSMRRDWTQKRT